MIQWPIFPYGGDYNPEQWPREVWREDLELMRRAGVNIATLPVFGWVSLEPEEGSYTFEWLDEILSLLWENQVRVCLATATASVPAWLTQKYPDVLVVDENGVRRRHGNRQTFCPNSPNFRRLSTALARKIAERYRDYPGLLLWHVSNEYCTYCYCELCAAAFRVWLQDRYGSLDQLNDRWYTRFWGHTYTQWDQIEPPTKIGEGAIQALKLDYNRFQSDALLECFKAEAAILREITPNVPITTNMMGTFFPLDYHRWAREMDVASFDSYPRHDAKPSDVAFAHALMRGLKEGQPFLLLEQSPSQQNWAPYNRVKPPDQLRLQSYQAIAHGADSVMYFQWRKSRGGIEKLHGAIVEHGGSAENRVFREVAELGEELQRVGPRLQNARVQARVAVLFDWPNWWDLKASSGPTADLDYPSVVRAFYGAFHSLGISTDVLSPEADLSGYALIVAPLLSMLRKSDADRVTEHVREGATLLTTFFSGFVDENDRVYVDGPPGPWREVLGLSVEETDALPPGYENGILLNSGETYPATLLAERVRLEGAEVVATYTKDFYADEPALTRHRFGRGAAYFLATLPSSEGLRHVMGDICREVGIGSPLAGGLAPAEGVEVNERMAPDGERQLFLLNHGAVPADIDLADEHYFDLLSLEEVPSPLRLAPREVRILIKNP